MFDKQKANRIKDKNGRSHFQDPANGRFTTNPYDLEKNPPQPMASGIQKLRLPATANHFKQIDTSYQVPLYETNSKDTSFKLSTDFDNRLESLFGTHPIDNAQQGMRANAKVGVSYLKLEANYPGGTTELALSSGAETELRAEANREGAELTGRAMFYQAKGEVKSSASLGCVRHPLHPEQQICTKLGMEGALYANAVGIEGSVSMKKHKNTQGFKFEVGFGAAFGVGGRLKPSIEFFIKPYLTSDHLHVVISANTVHHYQLTPTIDIKQLLQTGQVTVSNKALFNFQLNPSQKLDLPDMATALPAITLGKAIDTPINFGNNSEAIPIPNLRQAYLQRIAEQTGSDLPSHTQDILHTLAQQQDSCSSLQLADAICQLQRTHGLTTGETQLLRWQLMDDLQAKQALQGEQINLSKLRKQTGPYQAKNSLKTTLSTLEHGVRQDTLFDEAKEHKSTLFTLIYERQAFIAELKTKTQTGALALKDAEKKLQLANHAQDIAHFSQQMAAVTNLCSDITQLTGSRALGKFTQIASSITMASSGIANLITGCATFATNPLMGGFSLVSGAVSLLGGIFGFRRRKKDRSGQILMQNFQVLDQKLVAMHQDMVKGFRGLAQALSYHHQQTLRCFDQVFSELNQIQRQQMQLHRDIVTISQQIETLGQNVFQQLDNLQENIIRGFNFLNEQNQTRYEHIIQHQQRMQFAIRHEQFIQNSSMLQRQLLTDALNEAERNVKQQKHADEKQGQLVKLQKTYHKRLKKIAYEISQGNAKGMFDARLTGGKPLEEEDYPQNQLTLIKEDSLEEWTGINLVREYMLQQPNMTALLDQDLVARPFIYVPAWQALLDLPFAQTARLYGEDIRQKLVEGYRVLRFCHLLARPKIIHQLFQPYYQYIRQLQDQLQHYYRLPAQNIQHISIMYQFHQEKQQLQATEMMSRLKGFNQLADTYQQFKTQQQNNLSKLAEIHLSETAHLSSPLNLFSLQTEQGECYPLPIQLIKALPESALRLEAISLILPQFNENTIQFTLSHQQESHRLEIKATLCGMLLLQAHYSLRLPCNASLKDWLDEHWQALDGALQIESAEQQAAFADSYLGELYRYINQLAVAKFDLALLREIELAQGIVLTALRLPFRHAFHANHPSLVVLEDLLLDQETISDLFKGNMDLITWFDQHVNLLESVEEQLYADIKRLTLCLHNPLLEDLLAKADKQLIAVQAIKDEAKYYGTLTQQVGPDAYLYRQLGFIYGIKKRSLRQGIDWLTKAHSLRPDDVKILYLRATLALANGDSLAAFQDFSQVAQRQQQLITQLAEAQQPEARQIVQHSQVNTLARMVDALTEARHYEIALKLLEHTEAYQPGHPLQLKRAYLYQQLHLWQQADEIYTSILAEDPHHPVALDGMLRRLYFENDLPRALALNKQLITLCPANSHYQVRELGLLYLLSQQDKLVNGNIVELGYSLIKEAISSTDLLLLAAVFTDKSLWQPNITKNCIQLLSSADLAYPQKVWRREITRQSILAGNCLALIMDSLLPAIFAENSTIAPIPAQQQTDLQPIGLKPILPDSKRTSSSKNKLEDNNERVIKHFQQTGPKPVASDPSRIRLFKSQPNREADILADTEQLNARQNQLQYLQNQQLSSMPVKHPAQATVANSEPSNTGINQMPRRL